MQRATLMLAGLALLLGGIRKARGQVPCGRPKAESPPVALATRPSDAAPPSIAQISELTGAGPPGAGPPGAELDRLTTPSPLEVTTGRPLLTAPDKDKPPSTTADPDADPDADPKSRDDLGLPRPGERPFVAWWSVSMLGAAIVAAGVCAWRRRKGAGARTR